MKPQYKKLLEVSPIDHVPMDFGPTTKDPANIHIYRSEDNEENKAIFGSDIPYELVYFSDRLHSSNVFIKFPTNPYFIEMPRMGMSSQGITRESNVINPYSEYEIPIQVVTCGSNAFIKNGIFDYGFLKAVYNLDDYKDAYYRVLPQVHTCSYIFNVQGTNITSHQYLIVTRPVYNYSYEAMRCFLVDLSGSHIELEIDTFSSARDGGTTHIKLRQNDFAGLSETIIYVQTPLTKGDRKITVNGVSVELVDNQEINDALIDCVGLKTKESLYE